MHAEVETFLQLTSRYVDWEGADVIEVGAQNVNGSTRSCVLGLPNSWTGIDLVAGPGVDHVGDAESILRSMALNDDRYDIAVSTEVLEHAPYWADIVEGMCQVLRPGGALVLTCAANGRPPHGASGGDVSVGEWYQNVDVDDLRPLLDALNMVITYSHQSTSFPQDTRLVALRMHVGR